MWFTGRQFPPDCSKRRNRNITIVDEADDEDEDITDKKNREKNTRSHRQMKNIDIVE